MLRAAFNSLTRLHSRPGILKRLGTPDIFSPIRLTPSNYFRSLRGPEYTTVKGSEFVLPLDSMLGQFAQKLTLNKVPDDGDFKLGFGVVTTESLPFDASAEDIQTSIRLLSGFSDALVTGDFATGFIFTFAGKSSEVVTGDVTESTLSNGLDTLLVDTWVNFNIPWEKPILKGDRIINGSSQLAIDEIIEMYDVGAVLIGFRCRAD